MRPSEREDWVRLREGDVREDLGLVLGVHPNCLPDRSPTHANGVAMILAEPFEESELPKEFFGLYRLELPDSDQGGVAGR